MNTPTIPATVARLRQTFDSGKTRPIEWRLAQLAEIERAMRDHETDFAEALQKDLGSYQSYIEDLELVDFRVRIIGRGTDAVTRVWIDSQDGQGRLWTSMGVSANVVDASFQALLDAIRFKLIRDGASG